MTTFLRVGLLGGLLCFTGCATRLGPGSIKASHRPYNDSVIQTLNEQLLLNLVRLKYRDNPYFIEVSSITSQQSLIGTAGSSATVPFPFSSLRSLGVAGAVEYSDNPVISFQPLQGEEFLEKLMSPVAMEALLRLSQSGWSVSRVMRIAVEQANYLHNAPTASGPTPVKPPEYEDFKIVTTELRRLQQTNGIDVVLENDRVAMIFDESRISSAEAVRIRKSLGVDPYNDTILLTSKPSRSRAKNELYLQTRSLVGILFISRIMWKSRRRT